jgi:hypothetical protein
METEIEVKTWRPTGALHCAQKSHFTRIIRYRKKS